MKIIQILLIVILPYQSFTQKQGNIWYFGNHAGLDFNNTPPSVLLNGQVYIYGSYAWDEGCSSISDSSGSLLFYTNGEIIWNKNHQVMPNGNNLLGHRSSTQSSLIVPQPGSSRYYYVFTTDASENNFQNGLRYSIVDLCRNNGLGDVIPDKKNIKILDTTNERLQCVRHSNGIDYWIITHQNNSDAFYTFKLTSSGILDTIVYHGGNFEINSNSALGGQMIASPNGLHIAYAKPSAVNGFTLLLDFNPTTGMVSNAQTLSTLNTEYACAFSPDNSKLYFSTAGHGEIFQYDINAGNLAAIIASKTHIIQSAPELWRCFQLGSDGKIYLARVNKSFLSCIELPNSFYPACNFIDSAVYLGGKNSSWGLPNFIAGYDYSNATYDCGNGIEEIKNKNNAILNQNIPNPASNITQIEFKLPNGITEGEIVFYDIAGNEVKRFKVDKTFTTLLVSTADIAAGTYYYQLQTTAQNSDGKKMVVIK